MDTPPSSLLRTSWSHCLSGTMREQKTNAFKGNIFKVSVKHYQSDPKSV